MYDVILILFTSLTSLVFSYLIVILFNIDENSDSSLGRDLQQIMMQITGNILNTIFLPVVGIWNILVNMLTSIFRNLKWVVALGLFTICTLMMHYYHYEVLSIMDDSWKCFLIPLMNNIITPFLQITRVFYALFIPVVNGFTVMHAQFFKAWYITLTACSHINMFKIFEEIMIALIKSTDSFAGWFGWGGKSSPTNNMFYNDFNISEPVKHAMAAISVGQEVLTCACTRFEDLYGTAFFIVREPHVTAAIDNFYQTGIRIFQLFFKTLFGEFPSMHGEYPNLYKVMFKFERFVIESGLAADSIFFNTMGNIIKMFDNKFELNRFPHEFIFTIAGQVLASAAHLFVTIFINGPLHLMASFDSELTAKDPKVWSLEHSFALLHKSAYTMSVIIQWFVYVIRQIVTGKGDLSSVFKSDNAPISLLCDWARDVNQKKYVNYEYTAGCVTYNAAIIAVNGGAIVYGAITELLLKSLFTTKGQDVFRTLQRWEGPTIARKKVFTCLQREEATAYNYGNDTYYKQGWIWTQDHAVCQCDEHYGTTLDENVPPYNPWCGQPSLNQDIFAPLDALVMHASHGVLGPGFGDAFPFIKPIREIGINIEEIDLDMAFVLPLTLPPISRTAIETARVLTRIILSMGDILTGRFFNYPVNCGHGLNEVQLIARYQSLHPGTALPDNDADLRWKACELKKYKPKDDDDVRTPVCGTDDDNPNNNHKSCMCSYMEPLTTESPCQCIARYPDLDITVSSQQVGDLIEDRFTSQNVSNHWCNSMIIEWTFQNMAAFADALDYIVSLGPINPTCDVSDRIFEPVTSEIESAFEVSGVGETNEECDGFRAAGQMAGALACEVALSATKQALKSSRKKKLKSTPQSSVTDKRTHKSSGYLIANTPTLSFTGNFANANRKLDHVQKLYSNSNTGCGITTTDGIQQWACDVSAASVTSLDEKVSSMEEAGCSIWGRNDLFCSAGLYVRNAKRISINIARQVVNDGVSFMAGNYEDINLQTLPRLCDYERQQGALASMVASAIPNIKGRMREIFAKYVNIVLQFNNVRKVRMILTVLNTAITIVRDFVFQQENMERETTENALKEAIHTLIHGYVFDIIEGFKVTGDMFNLMSANSGDIFKNIADILTTVQDNLSQGMVELVAEFINLLLQTFSAMAGDPKATDLFLVSAGSLATKFMGLIVDKAFVILHAIYRFFGPVGDFFEVLTKSVCEALNHIMGSISFVVDSVRDLPLMGNIPSIKWVPLKCNPKPNDRRRLFSNHTAGKLGKHFLKSSDDEKIPKRVSETLDWNGTSVCDHFMSAAADYSYTELRPLEKAKWFECLEYKLMGIKLAEFFNSKTFPTDIFYNWKRKYIILYEFFRVLRITLPHVFKSQTDWAQIRMKLYENGIDADMYIKLFQNSNSILTSMASKISTSGALSALLEEMDPYYENPENPSSSAKTWRAFQKIHSSYKHASHEWKVKDMSQQMWKAIDTTYESHNHLRTWWNTIGHENKSTTTHTERVISNLKQHWKKGTSILRSPHHHSRPSWLGVPIKVGIERCSVRGSSKPTWCTECALLDNILESSMIQGTAMATFYRTYFPDILKETGAYFNKQRNEKFFSKRYTKLSQSNQQNLPNVTTTSTRWTYYVKNDWVYLVTNFTEYAVNSSFFTANSSHKTQWLGQVDRFLNASRKFFTYTDNTYVPYFGYSLFHIYDYLLFSSCNLDESIFITADSIREREAEKQVRLDRMDEALLTCLIIAIVIATNTSWSVIPLVWLANTVVIGAIIHYVYLYMVYGYMLSCIPLIPYTLVEDIFAWYDSRLQPGCFYKMLPYLAYTGNTTEDLCLTCSAPGPWTQDRMEANARYSAVNASTWNQTTGTSNFNGTYYEIILGQRQRYRNCAEYISPNYIEDTLSLKDLIKEYSIFWTSLFWIRWKFPKVGIFFIKNGILSFDSVLGKLALQAWQNAPIDNVWFDCYYAMWLNNILAGVVLAIAGYVTFKMAIIGVQTILQISMLTWYVYTSISWMSLTVENSVVINE